MTNEKCSAVPVLLCLVATVLAQEPAPQRETDDTVQTFKVDVNVVNVYFNVNCVVLDVVRITIGSNTLFGPGVHIYAATHSMSRAQRRTGLEFGKPVTIEDDVWVAGGAIVCPGVVIGRRSVIGAGSVVVNDIPPDVFAAGNPCRVIRTIADLES